MAMENLGEKLDPVPHPLTPYNVYIRRRRRVYRALSEDCCCPLPFADGGPASQEEIDAMLAEADTDGDGKLNYEEFVKAIMG